MSFSNNQSSLANQLGIDPQLDDIKNPFAFQNTVEDVLKEHAETINSKVGGLYDAREVLSFKQLFTSNDPQNFRLVYRKTFDLLDLIGNIAGSEQVQYPHQIQDIKQPFLVLATCATTNGIYFTSTYPDVYLDNNNIYFTNPTTTNLFKCIVVFEYTKE